MHVQPSFAPVGVTAVSQLRVLVVDFPRSLGLFYTVSSKILSWLEFDELDVQPVSHFPVLAAVSVADVAQYPAPDYVDRPIQFHVNASDDHVDGDQFQVDLLPGTTIVSTSEQ